MSDTSKTRKNYKDTRKNISKTQLGKLAEGLGLKKGLSPSQVKTAAAVMSTKVAKQALKRAGLQGFTLSTVLGMIGPAKKTTSKVRKDSRDKKAKSRSSMASDVQKAIDQYVREKAPPKKPKEIDKIGTVRVPLRKPKGMK
jgi:chorismate synthase